MFSNLVYDPISSSKFWFIHKHILWNYCFTYNWQRKEKMRKVPNIICTCLFSPRLCLCGRMITHTNIHSSFLPPFLRYRDNHQITPSAHGGAEESVRLLRVWVFWSKLSNILSRVSNYLYANFYPNRISGSHAKRWQTDRAYFAFIILL